MSGFSKIYCIGGVGGYMGADGLNSIDVQIWVGDADRQWFEAKYFNDKFKPMGKMKTVIPRIPDSYEGLLDACLAFTPDLFKGCPRLSVVQKEMVNVSRLDFSANESIPEDWHKLREEARPILDKKIGEGHIYTAIFQPTDKIL